MKFPTGKSAAFALLLLSSVLQDANATLVATNGGALVADTTNSLTWVSDGRLIQTLADAKGDRSAFVDDVIAAAGGVIHDSLGSHHLTPAEFGGVIYSDGRATWYAAMAFAIYLNSIAYQGYTDWRLPTTDFALTQGGGYPDGLGGDGSLPMDASEFGLLYYGQLGQVRGQALANTHNANYHLFTNLDDWARWSATEFNSNLYGAYYFGGYGYSEDNGVLRVGGKTDFQFQMLPVRSGYSIPAVPEPGSLALLALGLAGLGLSRRRKTH